jgi:hypothetical protein
LAWGLRWRALEGEYLEARKRLEMTWRASVLEGIARLERLDVL